MEQQPSQEQQEEALGLTQAGWQHRGQKFDPVGTYGGGLLRMNAVAEIYFRPQPIDRPDDWLEIWWIGPEWLSHIVLNGKTIKVPHWDRIPELIK